MSLINYTPPADGETADAADVVTPLNTIYNEFNGNIDNSNIKSAAAISTSKLADDAGITTAKIADGAVTPAKLTSGTGSSWTWQSWTPSWTNFTPGSATISARYTQIGKTVHFRIQVTLNGSTMGSDPQFSLPVTASSNEHIDRTLGLAHLKDASPAADNVGVVYLNSTTTAGIFRQIVSGSSIVYSAVTSTAPWTWANNDVIYLRGSYEAA